MTSGFGQRPGLDLSPQAVESLVPESRPPRLSGAARLRDVRGPSVEERAGGLESAILQRSLLWAAAAQLAFEDSGLWHEAGSVEAVTYGFLRLPDSDELAFGVTVYSHHSRIRPTTLNVAGRSMPVVYQSAESFRRQHRYPLEHPCRGTTACLATTTSEGTELIGLLTAGHVVAEALRGPVNLAQNLYQCSGTGRVAKFGPPRVDAAIVAAVQPDLNWQLGAPIQTRSTVAAGEPTRLRGQGGGVLHGLVATLSNPMLAVKTNYNSVEFLVLLDKPGRPGDSGALVTDPAGAHAVGLYLGDVEDITGRALGRCQLARQVELALACQLYEWL